MENSTYLKFEVLNNNRSGYTVAQDVCGTKQKAIATIEFSTNPDKFQQSVGEAKLNAILLADAGNTIQKCGLLPSELLAQRDELIKSITALRNELVFNGIMSEKNILIKDANAIIEKTKTA